MHHRDLSDGYFTPDNYKMLSGGDIDIPIYEAKMTGDSRLVVSDIILLSLIDREPSTRTVLH